MCILSFFKGSIVHQGMFFLLPKLVAIEYLEDYTDQRRKRVSCNHNHPTQIYSLDLLLNFPWFFSISIISIFLKKETICFHFGCCFYNLLFYFII